MATVRSVVATGRWVLWAYLAVAALWVSGAAVISVGALAGHDVRVDPGGNLVALSGSVAGPDAWFGVVQGVFFPLLTLCWLLSVAGQAISYAHSSGERRQQLKWLLAGAVAGAAGLGLGLLLSGAGLPGPVRAVMDAEGTANANRSVRNRICSYSRTAGRCDCGMAVEEQGPRTFANTAFNADGTMGE